MSERIWRVGYEYRDRVGHPDDEFVSWLQTPAGSIPNGGGIRCRDRQHDPDIDPETKRKIPAFVILITSEKAKEYHNPWDDLVDNISGNIHYWGDAKHASRGRLYNHFPGNARLEAINNMRLAGSLEKMPPVLHFSRKRTGYVTFNGLTALSDLRHSWFEDKGRPVKNLRALLSILDTETVPVEWLRQRVTAASTKDADAKLAPKVWIEARKGRIRRRHVWAAKIRSKTNQLPAPGSVDERILDEVRSLTPHAFEAFVVALVDKIPEIIPGLEHLVTRTRRTGDHGLDFFGMFRLPHPIAYQIDFIGEAKRHLSAITPDQVSRLVARLGRGQYGLYFTTSWYSEQTQREIEADRYPVRLFSGQDIIDILKAGDCVSQGKIRKEWLTLAIEAVPASVSDGLYPTSIW